MGRSNSSKRAMTCAGRTGALPVYNPERSLHLVFYKPMKNCMFQYALRHGKIIEDTGLITREEANALWNKYQDHIKDNWDEYSAPQMCIWVDCDSPTNYHAIAVEIDYQDCELRDGKFYKLVKIPITL